MKRHHANLLSVACLLASAVIVCAASLAAATAVDDASNAGEQPPTRLVPQPLQRGTWSDTVKDLIAATQDDASYRRVVLQELLASSNSFADTVCSHPEVLRCIGDASTSKGTAASESWPVAITIERFNGTMHWDKLPKATRILRVVESSAPIDVGALMRELPNGIETIELVRSHLTLGEPATNPALATLADVTLQECTIDAPVLDSQWLPVGALRRFVMAGCKFAAPSVASMLLLATELEEVRIVANLAPIRFREVLVELVARTRLKSVDFHAGLPSPGDGHLTELSFPRHLERLRLCNFSLRETPKALPPTLRVLEMPFNALDGQFPDLSDTLLEEIDFSNNSLSEFPTRLPTSIKRLRIASNKLGGSIDFTNLPRQLLELNVAHNRLTGPADLTRLPPRMEVFDVAYNSLTGPVNMREFPDSVRYVFLQNNAFTGRYDVTRLPLLSVRVLFGGNKWDSLVPQH